MDKNEIIFFSIVIIAYVLCAFTLNMPIFVHYIFIVLIAVALVISILLKYKDSLENEKISKISNIIAAILLIVFIINTIYEIYYHKTIFDSQLIFLLFFGALVVNWYFRK